MARGLDLAGRLLEQSGELDGGEFSAVAEEKEFRQIGEPLWAEKYGLETLKRMEHADGFTGLEHSLSAETGTRLGGSLSQRMVEVLRLNCPQVCGYFNHGI